MTQSGVARRPALLATAVAADEFVHDFNKHVEAAIRVGSRFGEFTESPVGLRLAAEPKTMTAVARTKAAASLSPNQESALQFQRRSCI